MSKTPYILSDWSGGMVDVIDSERLSPIQSEYLENFEYRDGFLRTRRGSWLLHEEITGESYQGAGIFKSQNDDSVQVITLIAQGGKIYRIEMPGSKQSIALPSSDPLSIYDEVVFVQALDKLYIFRGEQKTPWYWTGNASDSVVEVGHPSILDRIPGSDRVHYAFNRFWIATDTDTLVISDSLETRVDLANMSLSINKGDGQRITAIHEFNNSSIAIFKTNSIHLIENANGVITNASTDLFIRTLDYKTYGCIAKNTVTKIGNDLWFLSRLGVMSLIVNEENNVRLRKTAISYPIKNTIDRINWGFAYKASADFYDNYYLLSVPIDNSTINNAIIVFDFINNSWSGIWRFRNSSGELIDSSSEAIFEIAKLHIHSNGENDKIFVIGGNGEVLQILTNDKKDFVTSSEYGLTFLGSDSNTILNLTEGISETDILTQTSGMIHFKFRLNEDTASGSIFCFHEFATAPYAELNAFMLSGVLYVEGIGTDGTTDWVITSSSTLLKDQTYDVSITHDGLVPLIYINNELDYVADPSPSDNTAWFSDWSEIDKLQVGKWVGFGGGGGISVDMTLYSFGVYEFTGTASTSGKNDIVFFFPLNEGTGSIVIDYDRFVQWEDGTYVDFTDGTGSVEFNDNIEGLIGADISWTSKSSSSEIFSDGILSPFFKNSESWAKGINGEIRFVHKNPKLTLKMISPKEINQETLGQSEKTYSYVEYDSGITDWNSHNIGFDHNHEYRKNYSPVNFGSGLLMDTNGIILNHEVERSERFNLNKPAQRLQIRVINEQGTIGIKTVAGLGIDKSALNIGSQ